MANQAPSTLPDHLLPLLQPTPSGIEKLLAVWGGLTTETQLLILSEIKEKRPLAHLLGKFYAKALESTNPYVRYLVAKELRFRGEDWQKYIKRIEEDPHPLVRYCLLVWSPLLDYRPEEFFKLPQEARLASVRELNGCGEEVAALISYAVDHQLKDGTVSEIDLFEILLDYVNRAEFKAAYADERDTYGSKEYRKGQDIESLWTLVLKLPENISHVLIEHLPPSADLSTVIPEAVLQGMNNRQLTTLLSRQDIKLPELRKRIFFEADQERWEVRAAAICCNLDLTYQEFTQVLAKPEKERRAMLTELAVETSDLRLCLYSAIHDILRRREHAAFATDKLRQQLSRLKGGQRERQLRDLQLYYLARSAVPWGKKASFTEEELRPLAPRVIEGARILTHSRQFPEELRFLAPCVVEGDTWGTFLAFLDKWQREPQRTKELEKHLHSLWLQDWDGLHDDIEPFLNEQEKYACHAPHGHFDPACESCWNSACKRMASETAAERRATRLDLFSRIEIATYMVGYYVFAGALWILFILLLPLAEAYLPKKLNPAANGLMYIAYAAVAGIFSFFCLWLVMDFFTFLRRVFRMKPLEQIEQEVRESQDEEKERAKEWFLSRSEAEQRYSIWTRLEKVEQTKHEKLKLWIFVLGILIVFLILARWSLS